MSSQSDNAATVDEKTPLPFRCGTTVPHTSEVKTPRRRGRTRTHAQSSAALRSVRASVKHRSTDQASYVPVPFECTVCHKMSTLDVLAKRTAAWMTSTHGPDPLAMRFRLIWRRVHRTQTSKLQCGDHMRYPSVDTFSDADEVITNKQHGAHVIELMGHEAWPPLPDSMF